MPTMTFNADTPVPSVNVRCPRCGYDLRGIVATWIESCPLEGTCSECGLTFNWSEVLCPEKYEPRWCVEFVVPLRTFPAAAVKTFLRSFAPWRFWRKLRMSLSIRWLRLAAYIVTLLLPILFGYVVLQTATALHVRSVVLQNLATQQRYVQQQSIPSMQQWIADTESRDVGSLSIVELQQLQRARQQLQQVQGAVRAGYRVNISRVEAILEAVLFPWRSSSGGTITFYGGTLPYVAPSELHTQVNPLGRGPRPGLLKALDFWTIWGGLAGLWIFLLLPVCFVLLPVSRKRAKVRWRHIWRVTAYSVFIPATALTLMMLCGALGYGSAGLQPTAFWLVDLAARWFVPLALVVWWALAIGRYLKIPHGWWVAASLTAISLLLYVAGWWFLARAPFVDALSRI